MPTALLRPAVATWDVVRACERADAVHLERQIASLATVAPEAQATSIPIAGGTAALTVPEFGRKLNHIAGAWLEESISRDSLAELERAYAARAVPLEADLCPHAPAESLAILAEAGYCVNAYTNVYWLELDSPPAADGGEIGSQPRVREVTAAERERFVRTSIEGFAAQPKPRPRALLEALVRAALEREDSIAYVAELGEAWVATAATALLETELGVVAHLYLASALPEHRRRGAQRALLGHRLIDARARGAALATVTTRLGASSARNVERAGLALAYTRPTFAPRPPRE